ncbi:hypothetical protein BAWI5_03745 [Bacillus wiedmannii]
MFLYLMIQKIDRKTKRETNWMEIYISRTMLKKRL